MQRRSNGEGSIYQRTDGIWCASLQVDGRRKTVYGKTRKDASEKLMALSIQTSANGRICDSGKMMVEALLQEWLQQAAPRLRPTTFDAYCVISGKYLIPYLGHVKLSRLDPVRVARLYAALSSTLSKRRVESIHGLLHKVLSDAKKWGLIASNPADMVDAPRRDQMEHHLWSQEQASLFVDHVQHDKAGQYNCLFGFLLASGCRLGEAIGLRWADINWDSNTVSIVRQITEVRGKPVESQPKTKHAVRVVVLPQWGMDLLINQQANVELLQKKAGCLWQSQDRVFVSTNRGIPSRRSLRRAFEAFLSRHDLPRASFHDLRHFHLSVLAMNGIPVKVAQARAGHSSPVITMQVYQHIIGDPDRQAAQVIQNVLG